MCGVGRGKHGRGRRHALLDFGGYAGSQSPKSNSLTFGVDLV
jgi:hypothetical protein